MHPEMCCSSHDYQPPQPIYVYAISAGRILRFQSIEGRQSFAESNGGDYIMLDHFPTEEEYFNSFNI